MNMAELGTHSQQFREIQKGPGESRGRLPRYRHQPDRIDTITAILRGVTATASSHQHR